MAGKNREGSVANGGDVQVLDPVGSSWITILDLESCFSFFQVKQIKTQIKEQAKGRHIRGKDKSSNCQRKD